jgi:hypothetical protein
VASHGRTLILNIADLPGRPLAYEMPLPCLPNKQDEKKDASSGSRNLIRQPSAIRIVRHRMLYAKAALNAKGEASLGLRHIRA